MMALAGARLKTAVWQSEELSEYSAWLLDTG